VGDAVEVVEHERHEAPEAEGLVELADNEEVRGVLDGEADGEPAGHGVDRREQHDADDVLLDVRLRVVLEVVEHILAGDPDGERREDPRGEERRRLRGEAGVPLEQRDEGHGVHLCAGLRALNTACCPRR
jgi:hypothetical protein